MAHYAIRMETEDGTLEAAYHFEDRKVDAVRFAKSHAKTIICPDVVRIHVDCVATDMGVASFKVAR